ncbi:MAG: STAS domain-containing protein [Brevinematales bacterium]|jgi:stage II sporulation protein AA (anti-sigma F factor antagonist)
MQEELKMNGWQENGAACFSLVGYVNIETADSLLEYIRSRSADIKSSKFIFDVTGLEYVSSAGIKIFMDLYDKYKFSGGKMIFINMKPDVKRVFDLVGFMKYFIEASSFDEAMNNI